jgi:tellurite resistance protein TehA-like permease
MDDYDLITGPDQSPSIVLAIVLLVTLCGLAAMSLYSEYLRSRLRFHLRTLLIATTLVAAVLGLIVWLR